MDIFNLLTFIGGLALFLFGMNVMGKFLEKRAGDKLKDIIGKLTSNKFIGLLTGLGVTAIIQSSSATTVMVVGFVNSGIMNLAQAINVIMGANIGTTVTSWLLSLTGISGSNVFVKLLKPSSFSPILALVGIVLVMFSKKDKKKDTGMILLGFATLMFGMETMSGAVSGLKNNETFKNLFIAFENPILGVLVGALVTAVIQSSSASIGILQAFAITGQISYSAAIPIILGQNIGTCITAVLSSIGVNTNAKRVSVVHVMFNVLGALIFLPIYEFGHYFINYPFAETTNPFGIAVCHSIFNIATTVLLFPFAKQMEKLAYVLVKDKKDEKEVILDERLLLTPSIAINQCYKTTGTMAKITRDTLVMAVRMLKQYNPKVAEVINKNEVLIDKYQDTLESFLQKLSGKELSDEDSNKISQLILSISDFEKIADHAIHILNLANKMHRKEWKLLPETVEELKHVVNAVKEVFDVTVNAFVEHNVDNAYHVEPLEQVVDDIAYTAKKNHIRRVKKEKIHIKRGFVYAEILNDLERISDHCSNIATNIIQSVNSSIPKHILKNKLKDANNDAFAKTLETFKEQYFVEPISK